MGESIIQFQLQCIIRWLKIAGLTQDTLEDTSPDWIEVTSILASFLSINIPIIYNTLRLMLNRLPSFREQLQVYFIELAAILSQPYLVSLVSLLVITSENTIVLFLYGIYYLVVTLITWMYYRSLPDLNLVKDPKSYIFILFEFLYLDLGIHDVAKSQVTLKAERQKRILFKGLRATMRSIILIVVLSFTSMFDLSYNTKVLYLYIYIVVALSISVIVNLAEVVYYFCTGCTWLDFVFVEWHASRMEQATSTNTNGMDANREESV